MRVLTRQSLHLSTDKGIVTDQSYKKFLFVKQSAVLYNSFSIIKLLYDKYCGILNIYLLKRMNQIFLEFYLFMFQTPRNFNNGTGSNLLPPATTSKPVLARCKPKCCIQRCVSCPIKFGNGLPKGPKTRV